MPCVGTPAGGISIRKGWPRQILFVTSHYPTTLHPSRGAFVREFVHALARHGCRVQVINPVSFHRWSNRSFCDDGISIVRPKYFSLGSRSFRGISAFSFSISQYRSAVLRAATQCASVDAVFGHFMYPAGFAAVALGRQMGLPSFVAVGESSPWSLAGFSARRVESDYKGVAGILAVSEGTRKLAVGRLRVPPERVGVFPNGVDLHKFKARVVEQARKNLGLPRAGFLVGFVGSGEVRKGAERVLSAIGPLEGVQGVLLGRGLERFRPPFPKVAFAAEVHHDQVPEILAACDVFVLPTLAEGSCNSIIEALACGLPVVTSVGEFNDGVVGPACSIRVDPMDVREIRAAIESLLDDPERRREMGEAARIRAEEMGIDVRAQKVLEWASRLVVRAQ